MSAASCLWELMALILQFGLSWLAIVLAFLETLSSISFEALLNVLGLWPTVTIRAQDSAVLILNAEDGKPHDVINHVPGRCIHYHRYRSKRLSQILGIGVHCLCFVSRPSASHDRTAEKLQCLFCEHHLIRVMNEASYCMADSLCLASQEGKVT